MRSNKRKGLILLAVLSVGSVSRSSDDVSLAILEGTYLSSMQGGCSLELHSDASFALMCLSQPLRRGHIQVRGDVLTIDGAGPIPFADIRPRRLEPKGAHAPLGDPTSGPLVIAWPEVGRSLRLTPLRWGARLYLIRNADYRAFCKAIDNGDEPRHDPGGYQFLRRGDHMKPAGKRPPIQCEATK